MEPWEEQLDLDENEDEDDVVSHFPSFSLLPCNHRSSSSPPHLSPNLKPSTSAAASPPLIPGPAGAIQTAMHRRKHNQTSAAEDEPIPIPIPTTQEFIRRVFENGDGDDDGDFAADPWLCALDFLGGESPTPLGSIKGIHTHKVAKVVGVIKTCTPNGLGDLMLTLKDPTGTVGASIHHKALAEREFGRSICVGAVLVLQKVAVFSPSRSVCYLNVTLNNIVKVISMDSGPLVTKDLPICSVSNTAPINESSVGMPQEKVLPSGVSTQRILSNLVQDPQSIGSQHNSTQRIETGHTAPVRGLSGHVHCGSQLATVEKEPPLVKKATPNGISKMVREDIFDKEHVSGVAEEVRMVEGDKSSSISQGFNQVTAAAEKPKLNRVREGDNLTRMAQANVVVEKSKLGKRVAEEDNPSSFSKATSCSTNSVEIPDHHRITIGAKRPRQPLSLRTSLPDYTEEQLNLFDFD